MAAQLQYTEKHWRAGILTYVTLKKKISPLSLQTVYRSPKWLSPLFLNRILRTSEIHTSYDTCILIGDFNIHVDNQADTRAKEF